MSDFAVKITVLILYAGALIGYGIYEGRKTKSAADFNLGGRSVPGWVAGLSERASAESAWTLVGLPGYAFVSGVVSFWVALGLLIGNIMAWTVIAKRMREEAEKYDAQTYVDWIVKRHSGSKAVTAIRVLGSFIIIFLFAFYIDAQVIGGSKTLHSLFGLSETVGIILTIAVILPYAVYGGYQSVVYADCIQSLLMIGALVIAPAYGVYYVSQADWVWQKSVFDAVRLASPTHLSWTGGLSGIAAGFMIANNIAWVIAYLGGMPHLTTRFMSMKDEANWKIGRNVAITWTLFGYIGSILIGFVGLAMWGPGGLSDPEQVMPLVMLKIFPPVIAAVFITSAIAAMLSTADSMLIVTSSEFTENILKPIILKDRPLSDKQALFISRCTMMVVGLSALALAFVLPSKVVYSIVSFAWAALGNPFAVVTCASIFWRKYTGTAALWTMIVGFVGTIAWQLSPLNDYIDARLAGLFPAIFTAWLVTQMSCKSEGRA
ncbi:MAG: sodium/proline symporter [Synergistaceae bacterium]|nr:sodium/proline symporter [Synergistaceae bacterium]